MVSPPVNKFLARGAQHARARASPARVISVPKLSLVGSSFTGNLAFVAVLSSAFIPLGMTARTLAEYDRGGAVMFHDTSAPVKLVLSKDQNRNFLLFIERGPVKIGDVSYFAFAQRACSSRAVLLFHAISFRAHYQ